MSPASGRSPASGASEPLFIDGALTDASGRETFPNLNPATQEVIGVTADATGAAFHITTHAGQGCAVLSRLVLPRARYALGGGVPAGRAGWPDSRSTWKSR